jgi:hypothetical protein
VRKLADAPKHTRTGRFDALRSEQGKEAANQLIGEVNAELAARRARRAQLVEAAMKNIRNILGVDSGMRTCCK